MMEQKSVVKKTVDQLLDLAALVDKLEGVIPETSFFGADLNSGINIWPSSSEDSRRIVGGLIRLFKGKPEIKKWGATELEAVFTVGGIMLRVNRYRGRKCAVKKTEIVHEAVPERTEIIPAKESWVEVKEELVCEFEDVEKEVEAQVPATEPELAPAF